MDYSEKTLKQEQIFQGAIIKIERLTVELPNGHTATRDIVRHPGGAVVAPVTDDGRIIMVEQFRKPIEKTIIELPAGKLDRGEKPELCAARELREETGCTAEKLEKILVMNPTPAYSDETLHIYMATGLTQGESDPDEDEFISAKPYEIDEVLALIGNGTITDAKTIAGILTVSRLLRK